MLRQFKSSVGTGFKNLLFSPLNGPIHIISSYDKDIPKSLQYLCQTFEAFGQPISWNNFLIKALIFSKTSENYPKLSNKSIFVSYSLLQINLIYYNQICLVDFLLIPFFKSIHIFIFVDNWYRLGDYSKPILILGDCSIPIK